MEISKTKRIFGKTIDFDCDFVLPDSTMAICKTADISFTRSLVADFKKEYKNVDNLFRPIPGLSGLAAFDPPTVSQISG